MGRPCPAPDRRQNALCYPACDTVLDVLVELSRFIPFFFLQMCIARKEDVGEIVIPRRRYSIDIHAPLKCLRIMRGECRRRLIESVGRTLYVVAEIPREDGDRQDDHPCRRAKLTLTRPASACETHAPRKLIQRHCRTSLRTNSNDAIIAWNTPRVQSVKITLYEKRLPYEAHLSSYSSPSSFFISPAPHPSTPSSARSPCQDRHARCSTVD